MTCDCCDPLGLAECTIPEKSNALQAPCERASAKRKRVCFPSREQFSNLLAARQDRDRPARRIKQGPRRVNAEPLIDRRQQAIAVERPLDRMLPASVCGADAWPMRKPPPDRNTLIARASGRAGTSRRIRVVDPRRAAELAAERKRTRRSRPRAYMSSIRAEMA